jgi:hypothetical protein
LTPSGPWPPATRYCRPVPGFLPDQVLTMILSEWTGVVFLDLMRRRSDGMIGATEFLVASAALRCQEEGAEFLSLSGGPAGPG